MTARRVSGRLLNNDLMQGAHEKFAKLGSYEERKIGVDC
jgi:hypothetical protein